MRTLEGVEGKESNRRGIVEIEGERRERHVSVLKNSIHDSATAKGAPREKIGNIFFSNIRYSLVAYTELSMQTLRKKNSPCKCE